MSNQILPLGKLPAPLLSHLLDNIQISDDQVLIGPGPGMDCAVVEAGEDLLVFKTDPITFVTDAVGWYLVQINANDIATTGARPRWLLVTLLLPEHRSTEQSVTQIFEQINEAAEAIGVTVIGGHTEITHGLDRPIATGTLIGQVSRRNLITPQGAAPNHRLLLTKGLAIEATAIIAREYPQRLAGALEAEEILQAANYLYNPGISVVAEAQIAIQAGEVSAMHDPTEGGLAAALWELADACGYTLVVEPDKAPISELSARICRATGLDPFAVISSGSLLLAAPQTSAGSIVQAINEAGIPCAKIGWIKDGPASVLKAGPGKRTQIARPERDEITSLYES